MKISEEKIQNFRQAAILQLCQKVLWLCGKGNAEQEIIKRYDNKRTLSFAIEEMKNNLEYNFKSITTGNF